MQKRVLAIHDISCVGKCSLTVALPIISAAGAECSVLPTAVLSTHTGGFTGFTYRDLTEDIVPIEEHWSTLDLPIDCIYTGFLGSFEQIDLVADLFDRFVKKAIKAVDPVMADNGQLYAIFPDSFPAGMRKLCSKADLIFPNITEASLMLGVPYVEGPYTEEYIVDMLKALAALGPTKVVLTGVYFNEKELGAASYDSETGQVSYSFAETVPGAFHGTGDIFSSAVVGAIAAGSSLSEAVAIAVRFTRASIKETYDAGTDKRFGVNFEKYIPSYIRDIGL